MNQAYIDEYYDAYEREHYWRDEDRKILHKTPTPEQQARIAHLIKFMSSKTGIYYIEFYAEIKGKDLDGQVGVMIRDYHAELPFLDDENIPVFEDGADIRP